MAWMEPISGAAKAVAGPRILCIDDHPAVRRGVQEILADALPGAAFGHATDSTEALRAVKNSDWDVAVLDLNLQGQGGLDLIRGLKDQRPDLPILVYSVHSEEQYGVRAMRAGADGYLSKDRPPERIAEAISKLLKGGQYVGPELAAAVVKQATGRGRRDVLSDREVEVLRMLASGKSPSEIGEDLTLSAKTVSTYRHRVLEKLKLRTNADLVRYAIENGIVE